MPCRLNPSRGLVHPAWLGSVVLLAVNDHLLKGADVLPAPVTGKLSDLAGMMVAPLLLAAMLRVRTRGGWLGCHVAVGVGFAALQLSATVASVWAAATAAIGVPWVITRDPTDLLALPMLLVSAWGLLPAVRRRVAANARRTAEVGAAGLGLLCCVATSYDDGPGEPDCCDEPGLDTDATDDGGWAELPPFNADVFLSNQTEEQVVIRIRPLRTDVLVDCDTVEEHPGRLLTSPLFASAQSWTLPSNANLAVLDGPRSSAGCNAVLIEADTMAPTVLWWRDGQIANTMVPGEGPTGLSGEVTIGYGATGLELSAAGDLVSPSEPTTPPTEGACVPQADGDRIGWSEPVPWGPAIVEAVEPGVDGCLAIDLQRTTEQTETWYLCVPATSFPFVAGETIDVRLGAGAGIVEVVSLDEQGLDRALPSLVVSARQSLPSVPGLEVAALPLYSCEAEAEPTCGAVERPMSVVVGGDDLDAAEIHAHDEPVRLSNEQRVVEVSVMHAQERFVVDPDCGLGPAALGPDLEIAIAQWARTSE